MDFQELTDSFHTLTCVLSVEKTENGGCGEICIVSANEKCARALEANYGKPFEPGLPYDAYRRRDLNFEDICFRSAVMKEPIHTYIHSGSDAWVNVFAMPLEQEDENVCYCTFTMKIGTIDGIDLMSTSYVQNSAEVLKACIKLHNTSDFKKTMEGLVKDIRIICEAEVCTIMLIDDANETCNVLATNIMPGSTIKRVTQFVNFYEIAQSWLATIGDNDCLIIKSEHDMQYICEINHPWWLTLDEAGVDSVVMFPLRFNNQVLGFIWATNFDTNNVMKIKETLELTTYFVSSQIASYNMMKDLERISYTDLLTGVSNRNAMNNRVSDIVSGSEFLEVPFGIIFADLNGLKQVNDTCGHSAGDLLLKKAAILLQEIFAEGNIYRAGGDEFMIVLSGCTQEEFGKSVAALRERAGDPDDVCFAVGSYYVRSGCDVRDAMRLADEDMYRNKAEFYCKHPDRKHR